MQSEARRSANREAGSYPPDLAAGIPARPLAASGELQGMLDGSHRNWLPGLSSQGIYGKDFPMQA